MERLYGCSPIPSLVITIYYLLFDGHGPASRFGGCGGRAQDWHGARRGLCVQHAAVRRVGPEGGVNTDPAHPIKEVRKMGTFVPLTATERAAVALDAYVEGDSDATKAWRDWEDGVPVGSEAAAAKIANYVARVDALVGVDPGMTLSPGTVTPGIYELVSLLLAVDPNDVSRELWLHATTLVDYVAGIEQQYTLGEFAGPF